MVQRMHMGSFQILPSLTQATTRWGTVVMSSATAV